MEKIFIACFRGIFELNLKLSVNKGFFDLVIISSMEVL